MQFIPTELSSIRIPCSRCGTVFPPDWLKRRPFPMAGRPASGGGQWVRRTAATTCPSCGGENQLKLPNHKFCGNINLYGDEAARPLHNLGSHLYTYSLVGVDSRMEPEINDRIVALKRKLSPAIDPTTWKLHMKSIWHGNERSRLEQYAGWNRETVARLFRGVRRIMADSRIFKFNVLLIAKFDADSSPPDDVMRNHAYRLLVMHAIDSTTTLGAVPQITFDSHKDSQSEIIIHQWARDEFSGLNSNLLFAFISKGFHIPEPIFVEPASRPLLELADVTSFCVARYHYRKIHQQSPDVDLKFLGRVYYCCMERSSGDLVFKNTIGYPWKMDYPRQES